MRAVRFSPPQAPERLASAASRAGANNLVIECRRGECTSPILGQLRRLADAGVGLLFITHDLRLLPGFATRVVVMDAGRTVEEAATPAALTGVGRALVEATRTIAGGVL